jgi:hypothetical protein
VTDSALRDPAHRIESSCDVCGQLDDHPKVHHGLTGGVWTTRHHDCCAQAGCPDGSDSVCEPLAATGKTGADLLDHIQNGA